MQDGGTALQWAAYEGHEKIVRLLIERGADTNIRQYKVIRCLFFSSMEIWRLYINTGYYLFLALSPSLFQSGMSAIHHATGKGFTSIVAMLVEGGADMQLKDTKVRY